MKTLEDIKILNEAEEITLQIYSVIKSLPAVEKFGLSSQISRATVSVCANIAEGFYRDTHKDFRHFLVISRGSIGETIVLLRICSKLKYIDLADYEIIKSKYEKLIISINALIKYLKNHD
ncbi:MAG: S23 ribosomal [Candidatus Collierbacteria bacterium GW2011_GWB1_45_35]|uniref:S23 ribosomal n=2 Tax=Candidatus Collieribacteriota TaxID=1752725 RepID=A0A0G1NQR9_9BACT|nr:MAG: S23 ribosomal [Microgenomates group bacterium GW2011_GWC1_44_23]KKT86554.1 MAG: S23 ribosomal [Candidatus Collierbacteria bacterium GW2011_GWA2_44_99]KKT95839.1 MAG: S23 ribosomal [Candidatus Collierbacteria bacterium GW2011_GWA1_45_15]KKU00217.1 MAG: S23 ribosomal [Candidatus Collierbacteria bacterium GW2011_GWB2_45_17]KKU05229.1 MAG: S23 ribosomal [Candidatus Collierbacteria bacterium GW2011_GWB1_45_35]KKU07100.1 MAG: S23 ribosomal [Candidatus Collierbacteria bacterium GW2011_GWC2_45